MKVHLKMFHAGGGASSLKEVKSTSGWVKGATARIYYENDIGFGWHPNYNVWNDRTIFEWNGDFFVVDEIHNPLGYSLKPSIHWNLRPADDGSGLPQPVLQYAVFGSGELDRKETKVQYPYRAGEYFWGMYTQPKLYKSDFFQYVNEDKKLVTTDANVLELSRYEKGVYSNTSDTKVSFVSVFQAEMPPSAPLGWSETTPCGSNVVCLERVSPGYREQVIVSDAERDLDLNGTGVKTKVLPGINLFFTNMAQGTTFYDHIRQ